MRNSLAVLIVAFGLAACAQSTPPESTTAAASEETSDARDRFVGIYNGNSFETAMGMRITEDGLWEWRLAVGALDMRGKGTWQEAGGVITLTSDPKPVPAQFRFQGFEPAGDGPDADRLIHVFRPDGTQFTYAEANIECANGARIDQFVFGSNAYLEGYEPDECDRPIAVTVKQENYDITSTRYDLVAMGWQKGQIMRFEFDAKDLGVADFTGMRGTLRDGVLTLSGGEWPMELRKMPPRDSE